MRPPGILYDKAVARIPDQGERIILAGPFVIAAGHLVEHAWSHDAFHTALRQQEIDRRRERESGTGTFPALVEDDRGTR